MSLLRRIRTTLIALSLVVILSMATACSSSVQAYQPTPSTGTYTQLERGNSSTGQNFGNWVVKTAHGLVQDAYVRDNDKLGIVITPQVKPNEVRSLTNSLVQGFQKNFPKRDLTVLVYAPDKKLILTAKYDDSTRRIEYQ